MDEVISKAEVFAEGVSRRLQAVRLPEKTDTKTLQAYSMVQRMVQILDSIRELLRMLRCTATDCREVKAGSICRGPLKWYVASVDGRLAAVRTKFGTSIAFMEGEALVFREGEAAFSMRREGARICYGRYCVDVRPSDLEDVKNKRTDLVYLLARIEAPLRRAVQSLEEYLREKRIEC